jgi:hypothetical protein
VCPGGPSRPLLSSPRNNGTMPVTMEQWNFSIVVIVVIVSPGVLRCRGPRSSPGSAPNRDPAGVALAAPNSARTTSRPVTRTNRRTGDLPPTPHHVPGRGGRSCPLEPHPSPDAARSGRTNRRLRRLGYAYQGKTRQGCQRPSRLMSTGPRAT